MDEALKTKVLEHLRDYRDLIDQDEELKADVEATIERLELADVDELMQAEHDANFGGQ